jgi:ParB family chromosome partitioning protein
MPAPHTLHHLLLTEIPVAEIDAAALTRDREGLDAGALTELRLSIAASGLRIPIEVFPLPEPKPAESGPPYRYGLISGLRRLRAFQALHELTGQPKYAAIPAFLHPPGTMAEALASMVEENEIRAAVSPWERGRIAYLAHRQGAFGTIEEAVAKLFPAADRKKRTRLRALAHLAEELDGWLTAPETLNQRQALRLASAFDAGFGEVIRTALEESKADNPQTQWQLLLPILIEAETPPPETPIPRPGCPRRIARPRPGLTIRREQTRDGWCLHFTGREATSWMLDDVFGDIERMFGPE